jgi:hypothetical protein
MASVERCAQQLLGTLDSGVADVVIAVVASPVGVVGGAPPMIATWWLHGSSVA